MGEKRPEDMTYTFTGHLIQDEGEEPKKEIHIHIEHLENLEINF